MSTIEQMPPDGQQPLKFTERTIHTSDWDLNVATAGDGPPIVFMHALGGSWRWWLPTMNALPRRYRFCAFDFPGAGKSAKLTQVPSSERFIGALDQLFEQLNIRDGQLVGHSLGGYIALVYAMLGEVKFKKIVSIAPCGMSRLRTPISLIRGLRLLALIPFTSFIFSRILIQSYRHLLPMNSEIADWIANSYERRSIRSSLAYQLMNAKEIPSLRQIQINSNYEHDQQKNAIKLFWGEKDRVFPSQNAYELAKSLKDVELTFFGKSRHWPHFDEYELFMRELKKFLD